jgi:hypothetical protein
MTTRIRRRRESGQSAARRRPAAAVRRHPCRARASGGPSKRSRAAAALARSSRSENPTFAWLHSSSSGFSEAVDRVWGPVSHLNSVKSTPELRAAFNDCLPLITEFGTDMSQNERLYKHFVGLDRRLIAPPHRSAAPDRTALRDFRLAGVALAPEARRRFREIMLTLAARQATFEQNLMDATDAFAHHEPIAARSPACPTPCSSAGRGGARKGSRRLAARARSADLSGDHDAREIGIAAGNLL